MTLPDLKPDPQDMSTFYLASIHQLLNATNTHASILPTAAKPPVFSPPRYIIWVNSLWFLSLLVSLTSAVMATSLQEWARRYIRITQQARSSPENQARMRAVIANGMHKSFLLWGGDGLSTFLHLSVFLFVAGALVYLYHINLAVFYAVAWWVGCSAFAYGWFTLLPIFKLDFLLYTPLSERALNLYLGILYVVFRVFPRLTLLRGLCDSIKRHYHDMHDHYRQGFLKGKLKAIEETASKLSPKIDAMVLERIFLSLDEDHALERFIDAIPGFCHSPLVNTRFPRPVPEKLREELNEFLDRTFSSNSTPAVSESVRSSRLISCLNAAHAALGQDAILQILDDMLNGQWQEALQSVEMGHSLRRWGLLRDSSIDLKVRRIVACIIARARERDECWMELIKDEFGVPDHVLRDYVAHGNSLLLATLIHVIRQSLDNRRSQPEVLRLLSAFNILDTLPELQHDFCALWNEMARESRKQVDLKTPTDTLRDIRHLYISLHPDIDPACDDEPSLYPLCDIACHRPHSTTHIGSPPEIPVDVSPRPTCLESQQHPHTRPDITSPPDILFASTNDLLHIPSQAIPVTHLSIFCYPGQSALSATDTDANVVRPPDPSPSMHTHTSETDGSSRAPAATSNDFAHPSLVAALTPPFTGPNLPSFPIPVHTSPRPTDDPSSGDVANAPYITLAFRSSHPLVYNEQQDVTTQCAAPNLRETTVVPPTSVSGPPPSSPAQADAASRSDVMPTVLLSSSLVQHSDVSGALRSQSSSPTVRSHICLQGTPILDTDVPTNIGTASANDTPDLDPPISIGASCHAHQTGTVSPDIAEHAS